MQVLSFVVRRILRRWPLMLTVTLGVVIATALLACAPLLTQTVMEISLHQAIGIDDPLAGHIRVSSTLDNAESVITDFTDEVNAVAASHLKDYSSQTIFSTGSPWLFPWVDEEIQTNIRVNVVHYEQAFSQTSLVAGSWPLDKHYTQGALPIVIGEDTAYALSLSVGDELPLSMDRNDGQPEFYLQVRGIVRAQEPESPYWFGMYGPLQPERDGRYDAQYSVLVDPQVLSDVTTLWFPRSHLSINAHLLLNHDAICFSDLDELSQALNAFRQAFDQTIPSVSVQTQLPEILDSQIARARVIRVPLYVMLAEIALLALYYVIMTSSLSIRHSESEFATAISRGASRGQMLGIQSLEALILSAIALLCGPLIGKYMILGLTYWGPVRNLLTNQSIPITTSAWVAGGLGAAVSFCGLLLPMLTRLKAGVISQKQNLVRDLRKPWWQRYYLDVIVTSISIVLLWRVHIYGSILGLAVNTEQLDWLLLLSPVILLLGSSTILLRLFPLILRLLAGISVGGRGIITSLALWTSSRNPSHVTRLVLLLTLAMALGVLSTGINATLSQSESERAAYAAGTDYRIQIKSTQPQYELADTSGTEKVDYAWRGNGSSYLLGEYKQIDILGIDAAFVQDTLAFRDDFASESLPDLLESLLDATSADLDDIFPPVILPAHPKQVGLWLWAPPETLSGLPTSEDYTILGASNHERVALSIKLYTHDGTYMDFPMTARYSDACATRCRDGIACDPAYPFSRLESYECRWVYYAADLPDLPDQSYPLTLDAIWIRNRVRADYHSSVRTMRNVLVMLSIDDITVIDADTGLYYIVEDFEKPSTVWASNESTSRYKSEGGHNDAARYDIMPIFSGPGHEISFSPYQTDLLAAVPALISSALADSTGLVKGDIFHSWVDSQNSIPFEVYGVVDYFPTMYDAQYGGDNGFVITDYRYLIPRLNAPISRSVNPNEIWISTADNQIPPELIRTSAPEASTIISQEEIENQLRTNPFTLGLRSATLYGFIVTALLSVVGFFTYFYISTKQHATMYGVLRAQGLSPVQLYSTLLLEQIILILWGLGLGTGLGIVLNRLVLNDLPISLGDLPPVPPFIPQTEWHSVLRLYLLLAATFILVIGIATYALWRSKLHSVLRIGQE